MSGRRHAVLLYFPVLLQALKKAFEKIGKTKRLIERDRRSVSFYYLEVCFCRTKPDSFREDGAADRGGIVTVPVCGVNMNSIDADVIPVADTESGGNDRSCFVLDRSTDCFFWDCAIHGRNDHAVHYVCCSF